MYLENERAGIGKWGQRQRFEETGRIKPVMVVGERKSVPKKWRLLGSVEGLLQNTGDQEFIGVPVSSTVMCSAQPVCAGRGKGNS